MAGIIQSVNYITGDVRIVGGSVVVDNGADRGLLDETGNYAGSFASGVPANTAFGFQGNTEIWAMGLRRFTVGSSGIIKEGETVGYSTRKQIAHCAGLITYAAGVPSYENALNIASLTDVGVGQVRINYTTQAAVGNPPTGVTTSADTGAGSIAQTQGSSLNFRKFNLYDSAGSPADIDFSFVVMNA